MQVPDNTNGMALAELICTGGQVHTVNASNDLIEAVAVGGGHILAVGCTLTFELPPVLGHVKSSCVAACCCPALSTHTAT